jgi:uncharacterized protein (DUF1697 family)
MSKYIALLRGINVGGNNRVEMPKLKKTFESLGFQNVSTYINTGNVIFETDQTKRKILLEEIEEKLRNVFGFEIRAVLRDVENITKLVKKIPKNYSNDSLQKTDVLFLWGEFDNKKSLSLIKTSSVDNLMYIDGAIVWKVDRKDYPKSGMHKFIGTTIYKNMTARNVNTVRKIYELLQ